MSIIKKCTNIPFLRGENPHGFAWGHRRCYVRQRNPQIYLIQPLSSLALSNKFRDSFYTNIFNLKNAKGFISIISNALDIISVYSLFRGSSDEHQPERAVRRFAENISTISILNNLFM